MKRALRSLFGLGAISSAVACSFIVDTDEIDAGCAPGTKYCEGRCVDVNDAAYGCTLEGCGACTGDDSGDFFGDRYIPKCDRGECVIDRCAGDYGCDECNRHLLTDEQNCGECMHVCDPGSTCSVGTCVAGDDGASGGGAGGDSAQSDASAQQQKPTL